MKRPSPLKRGALSRRSPLRRESRKRSALNRVRRKVVATIKSAVAGRCQIRIAGVCRGAGSHTHEILPRGRGGSIVDPANQLYSCFPCNQWVHSHPLEAERLGFLVSGHRPIQPSLLKGGQS